MGAAPSSLAGDALIREHEEAVKDLSSAPWSAGMTFVENTMNHWTKPASASSSSRQNSARLAALRPIGVDELQRDMGVVNRGRVLRGRLIVQPYMLTAVQTLLQDEDGDIVKVCFYNMVPDSVLQLPIPERQRVAAQAAPKGMCVAIIEPFFKVFADGTPGVRVDDPTEVVVLPDDDIDEVDWAVKASKHLDAGSPTLALQAAGRALRDLPHKQLLTALLCNAAACEIPLGRPATALQHAALATAIDTESHKAFFRVAVALDAIAAAADGGQQQAQGLGTEQLAEAARWAMGQSVQLQDGPPQLLESLMSKLKVSSGTRAKGSKGERDDRGSIMAAAALINSLLDAPPSGSSGHSTAAGPEAAAKGKDKGNAAFQVGNHTTALGHYLTALVDLVGWTPAPAKHIRIEESSGKEDTYGQRLVRLLLLRAEAARKSNLSPTSGQKQPFLSEVWAASAAAVMQPKSPEPYKLLVTIVNRMADVQHTPEDLHSWCSVFVRLRKHVRGMVSEEWLAQNLGAVSDAKWQSARDRFIDRAQVGTSDGSGLPHPGKQKGKQKGGEVKERSGQGKGVVSEAKAKAPGSSQGAAAGHTSSQRAGAGSSRSAEGPQRIPEFFQSERQAGAMTEGKGMEVEELHKANQMRKKMMCMPGVSNMTKSLGLKGEAMTLDERVAKFHEEFEREGKWPAGCDVRACKRHLWSAYEHAYGAPLYMGMVLMSGERPMFQPEDMFKRLGCVSRERFEWLLAAPMKDVSFRLRGPYMSSILHSFSNMPAHKQMVLSPGKVHVAIGFLDLGSLAACVLEWPTQDKLPAGQPLRWVGYDSSAYAVAKTLVVLEMLKGGAETDAVLQVWYSSAWTRASLSSFREALQRVLQGRASLPQAVLRFLDHWQDAGEVPLAKARAEWLDRIKNTNMKLGNFKAKADRLALCGYCISGQLLGGEVGSTVMSCLPPGSGEMALDEHFLQTFSFFELMEKRIKGGAPDLITAGIEMARLRLARLGSLLRSGHITVEVHLGTIGPQSPSLLASIKALRPWTISWSNVPDYMEPRVFHRVARACSGDEDTVHYMHSMNWVMDVKGACHLDYHACMRGPQLEQVMETMVEASRGAISLMYNLMGADKLLLAPPVDNARNIVDLALYTTHFQAWVDEFFRDAGFRDPNRQCMILEPPLYNVLSRSNSTFIVGFTYDPKIKLQMGFK